MRFSRRKDLSDEVRQEIAIQALLNKGVYGTMTRLALSLWYLPTSFCEH